MPKPSCDLGLIYRIYSNKALCWEEIQKHFECAIFCRSSGIEVDSQALSDLFISKLVSLTKSKNLDLFLRYDAGKVVTSLLSLPLEIKINVYFGHSQDLAANPNFFDNQRVTNFILVGNKKTDFLGCYKLFSTKKDNRLYFHFPRFNPEDPDSLSVHEIANIIEDIKQYDPGAQIKPPPGLDLCDHNSFVKTELNQTLMVPEFEKRLSQSTPPKFSFIIPTHNSKFFLQNVVRHILNQNYDQELFEIIVVDDGGTDHSGPFLRSYIETEKVECNFKYIYWPKPILPKDEEAPFRPGISRNLGAYHSRGEYLIFLDSDILLPSNFIDDLFRHFQNYDVIQYVRHHISPLKSNSYVSFKDVLGKKDLYIEESRYWGPFFSNAHWMDLPFFWKYTCTYCLALRSSDFFRLGGFRRSFISYGFEDTDLGFRLAKNGRRFYLSKLVTLHLTPQRPRFHSFSGQHDRFLALSKTAKIFFLLNLDLDIYRHLYNYMGGELSFSRLLTFYFERFLRIFSKPKKASEIR